jgi:hypothetical protein
MTTLTWPNKHPLEVLDYSLNWTNRLAGDTVVTSTWGVPNTLTVERSVMTGANTTVWLSGGTISDVPMVITNTITTSGGRTMTEGVLLKMADV